MSSKSLNSHVIDHVAITQVVNRYTDAVNRRDWSGLSEVFAEDAIWDVGGNDAGPFKVYLEGRPNVVDGIRNMVGAFAMLVQTNHALVIHVHENQATATSTMEERFRAADGDQSAHVLGTYYDTLVRDADGEWRFRKRIFRFTYIEPVQHSGTVMTNFPIPGPA